jgi:hypothetical protein
LSTKVTQVRYELKSIWPVRGFSLKMPGSNGLNCGFEFCWVHLELIGGKLVYPVELPGVGTYARCADGDVPDQTLGELVLKRALDIAWRGASVLLDVRPTTPLDLRGMELAGSGHLIAILTREELGS